MNESVNRLIDNLRYWQKDEFKEYFKTKQIMLPKKIYLTEQELQDTITCERMVSIDEPYRDMTEEYTNLNQVWHDANE